MVGQKSLSLVCHSGLDLACPVLDTGESSVSEVGSRWSLPRTCRLDPATGYGAGMTGSELMVRSIWIYYARESTEEVMLNEKV